MDLPTSCKISIQYFTFPQDWGSLIGVSMASAVSAGERNPAA
jgi:hypothetical protein